MIEYKTQLCDISYGSVTYGLSTAEYCTALCCREARADCTFLVNTLEAKGYLKGETSYIWNESEGNIGIQAQWGSVNTGLQLKDSGLCHRRFTMVNQCFTSTTQSMSDIQSMSNSRYFDIFTSLKWDMWWNECAETSEWNLLFELGMQLQNDNTMQG